MKRRAWAAGFLLLLAFDTAAQLSLKFASLGALPLEMGGPWLARLAHQPALYAALAAFVGAFVVWMTLLRRAPIGPAFAASHLELVAVLALSHQVFGDRIGATQLAGACLIVAGVACLAMASGRGPAPR